MKITTLLPICFFFHCHISDMCRNSLMEDAHVHTKRESAEEDLLHGDTIILRVDFIWLPYYYTFFFKTNFLSNYFKKVGDNCCIMNMIAMVIISFN